MYDALTTKYGHELFMIETKDPYLEKILDLVREKRNLDFSQYRGNLLARRVMARVRMAKCDNFQQYFTYLKLHGEELDLLMNSLTINVTEFFRDARAFEVIEKRVIPDFINKKRTTINIWSCGSSSGEEAYSMLMLIAEYLGPRLADYKLKICGTDIDNQSLAKAREGVYEAYQFRNLDSNRKKLVDKYFYDMGNSRYRIKQEWPKFMDFQYHDVIADPPLEHMDIILCRNLFIYFDRDLQSQVLERLCQSLNKGGFLVLGIVESLMGPIRGKFIEYDRDARIYVKR